MINGDTPSKAKTQIETVMVLSDIHDNLRYLKKALEIFDEKKIMRLYLLGDIGQDAFSLLNTYHEKIIAVRGNCDTIYDVERAEFPMPFFTYDYIFGNSILLMHGDKPELKEMENLADIVLTGHTHVSKIERDYRNGKLYANPGSLSLPRDGHHSYLLFDENSLSIFDIDTKNLLLNYKLK